MTVAVTVANSGGSDDETVAITHRASGGAYDHVYPAGIGGYAPGARSSKAATACCIAAGRSRRGRWCNINSAYHYAPGTGTNWQDAWIRL